MPSRDASGIGGSIVVEQLSNEGITTHTVEIPFGFVQTVDDMFTVGAGVSAVRVKLQSGFAGLSSFDDVRLWRQ